MASKKEKTADEKPNEPATEPSSETATEQTSEAANEQVSEAANDQPNGAVTVEAGTEVHLVLANGKHRNARITRLCGDDRVDLEANLPGETLVITNSPRDDSGKLADSWHLPEPL